MDINACVTVEQVVRLSEVAAGRLAIARITLDPKFQLTFIERAESLLADPRVGLVPKGSEQGL